MTRIAYVTHQKGSWRWQDRFQKNRYIAYLGKNGVWYWKLTAVLDTFVKPKDVGTMCHNRAHLTPTELYWLSQVGIKAGAF